MAHPGAKYAPVEVMEDDFDTYNDIGTTATEVVDNELYIAIGEDEYRVDQRVVNDLEIAALTEIIGTLIKLTQSGGSIEKVNRLKWRATLAVCDVCPDIPKDVASCEVVYYEENSLKGESYIGKKLNLTLEEMVIMMGVFMQAYHNNRPKRIQDFVAFNSDRIDDNKVMKLQKVIEADEKRAAILDTDFTDNIIDGYLEYARQIEATEDTEKPVSATPPAAPPSKEPVGVRKRGQNLPSIRRKKRRSRAT